MSPEKAAIKSLDNRNRGTEIAESASKLLPLHEQISPVLEKMRINPDDFVIPDDSSSLYTKEMVDRDNRKVAESKKQFAINDREKGPYGMTMGDVNKLADIAEYQVLRGINLGNWMPYCRALRTSEYDDYINGVDAVVEFMPPKQNTPSHFGLGVDVSFATKNLDSKFQRIKREIDSYDGRSNRMASVKYYDSPATGMRGELHSMSRVVAALDLGVIEDLTRTKKDRLEGHIAGHALLMEMRQQLETFSNYAQEANQMAVPHLDRARRTITILSNHLDSEAILEDSGYEKNRDIENAIREGLEIFR